MFRLKVKIICLKQNTSIGVFSWSKLQLQDPSADKAKFKIPTKLCFQHCLKDLKSVNPVVWVTFEYSGLKHFIKLSKGSNTWPNSQQVGWKNIQSLQVSDPTETMRLWQCPILHYLSFSSYLCVPKWSLVLGQMLLSLSVTNPKLHKKHTEPSSVSLLFRAPWITAAVSFSSAE